MFISCTKGGVAFKLVSSTVGVMLNKIPKFHIANSLAINY